MKKDFGKFGTGLVLAITMLVTSMTGFTAKVFASSKPGFEEIPFTMPYGGTLLKLEGRASDGVTSGSDYYFTADDIYGAVAIYYADVEGEGRRYGLCDIRGNIIVPPKFTSLKAFDRGFAPASFEQNGIIQECYIDTKGNRFSKEEGEEMAESTGYAISMSHPSPKEEPETKYYYSGYSEGYNMVIDSKSGKRGFATDRDASQGKVTIPTIYDHALSFSEGLACVAIKDKYGYIGLDDEVVIPIEYELTSAGISGYSEIMNSFSDGYALVKREDEYFVIKNPLTTASENEKETIIAGAKNNQDAVAKLLVKDGIYNDSYNFGDSIPEYDDTELSGHTGIDVFNMLGLDGDTYLPDGIIKYPLLATGMVVRPKNNFGNCVTIETRVDDKLYTLVFAHMQEVNVEVGQTIEFGTNLGTVGETGAGSNGIYHLHFEVRRGQWLEEDLIDPVDFVLEN